jgi:hypothetical protein
MKDELSGLLNRLRNLIPYCTTMTFTHLSVNGIVRPIEVYTERHYDLEILPFLSPTYYEIKL